jgi:hypothetical protein
MYYRTSAKMILAVAKRLKANPDTDIPTGMWSTPTWNRHEFWRWFHRAIADKINHYDPRQVASGRYTSVRYQQDLLRDQRTIRSYLFERTRNTGCRGLLLTAHAQRAYPHINNQTEEA